MAVAPIDQIRDALAAAIEAAITARKDELTAIAVAGGDAASGGLLGDVQRLSSIINGIVGSIVGILPIIGDVADPFKLVEDAGGKIGSGVGIGYLLGYAAWSAMEPVFEPIQHGVANLAQTAIFDPNTAADLQARGIIDETYGRSEAAGGNMSGEHYDKLVTAAESLPTPDQALELYRRQVITQTQLGESMTHAGIPAAWQDYVQFLARTLLSPADLALAQLRGAIQPAEAQQYAATLGMEAADFQTLILNTGEPPGAEQMMEALRRGFIDDPTFTRAILQSRIRNEWIPTMLQLRYSPMTTADAVRAVVENYMTPAQGAAIAQQNGLEPDHWTYLYESWGRPLAHDQMLRLFYRGKATLDDVRQAMRESDLKDKYIDQAIALGEVLPPERQVTQMIQHEVIDRPTGLSLLEELGYSTDNANRLIDLGVSQRTTSHKTLTKADILTSYADALFTRKDASDRLAALGYQPADVTAMLDLADYKARAASLKTTERGIEATLKMGHITQDQAKTELVKAGLDVTQAATLVDEWTKQARVATRTLTEAQTLKALKGGIIKPADATARLQAMGYGSADIRVLYLLDSLNPDGSPPAAPAAATGAGG